MIKKKRKKLYSDGGWLYTPYKDSLNEALGYVKTGLSLTGGAMLSIAGYQGKKEASKIIAGNGQKSYSQADYENIAPNLKEGTWTTNEDGTYSWSKKQDGGFLNSYAGGGTMNKIGNAISGSTGVLDAFTKNAGINEGALSSAKSNIASVANNKVTSNSFDSLLMDLSKARNAFTGYTYKDFKQSTGSLVMNTINGGLSGASAGSSFGPWGAAIGAVVGLGAGIAGWFTGNSKARKQADTANKVARAANIVQSARFANLADKLRKQQARSYARSFVADGGELNFGQYLNDGNYAMGGLIGNTGGAIDYANQLEYLNNYRLNALNKQNILSSVLQPYINELKLQSTFGFGGNLGTNGSDFTDGLTYFNVPTRHETNPNGGIPLGIAPDGQPNLVEGKEEDKKGDGGEIKWNELEYIFSDRLKPTQALIEKWHLPKNFLEYTYADCVRKSPVIKEAEERPNDPKSLETMDKFLADVAEDLENQKKEKEAQEMQEQLSQMSPEELAQVNTDLEQQLLELALQEAAMAELQMAELQMALLGISPELMQLQLMQLQMPIAEDQPIMGACGGHLNAEGGDLMVPQETPAITSEQLPTDAVPELISEEQLPIEEELEQDGTNPWDLYEAAEDMSTKDLNKTIEDIIAYAKENKDKALLREARKIQKSTSRDRKEEFVDETILEIREEWEELKLEEQEKLKQELAQLPVSAQEVAAQAQGPVAQDVPLELELILGEMPPQMFGDGGDLDDEEKLEKELKEDIAKAQEDTPYGVNTLDNVEVVYTPESKDTPKSERRVVSLPIFLSENDIASLTGVNDIGLLASLYARKKKKLEEEKKKREFKEALLLATTMEELGVSPNINSLFEEGGTLNTGHSFDWGGHVIYDSVEKGYRTINEDGAPSPRVYKGIVEALKAAGVKDNFEKYIDAFNQNEEWRNGADEIDYTGTYNRSKFRHTGYIVGDDPAHATYSVLEYNGKLFLVNNRTGEVYDQFSRLLRDRENLKGYKYYHTLNENIYSMKDSEGNILNYVVSPDGTLFRREEHNDNGNSYLSFRKDEYATKIYKDPELRYKLSYMSYTGGVYTKDGVDYDEYYNPVTKKYEYIPSNSSLEHPLEIDKSKFQMTKELRNANVRTSAYRYDKNKDKRPIWEIKDGDLIRLLRVDEEGNVYDENGKHSKYFTDIWKNNLEKAKLITTPNKNLQINQGIIKLEVKPGEQPLNTPPSNAGAPATGNKLGTEAAVSNDNNNAGAAATNGASSQTGTEAAKVVNKATITDPDTGKPYKYNKNLEDFKYYDKDKKAYNLKYLDFLEELTDDQIKDLMSKDGYLAPEGDLYLKYALDREDPSAITAEMLKSKLRGAADGKYGYKHDFAAALFDAWKLKLGTLETSKLDQEKVNTEVKTDVSDAAKIDAAAKAEVKKDAILNKYRIRYPDVNGASAYHILENYDPSTSIQAIENVYDPEKHILTAPGKEPDADGYYTFDRGDRPKTQEPLILKQLPTWMRYAPLLDYAEAPSPMDALSSLNNASNNFKWAAAPRHGEYLKYQPVDTLYRLNQIVMDNNAARRGIMNAANSNTGMLMANMALQNSKAQQAMGENLINSETENWNRKKDVITQHNQVDLTYDLLALDADKANMSNNSLFALIGRDSANILWEAALNQASARNATRTNFLSNLGAIGKENLAYNRANNNPALRYSATPSGSLLYRGIGGLSDEDLLNAGFIQLADGTFKRVNAKNGGCLTIKRKRRIR